MWAELGIIAVIFLIVLLLYLFLKRKVKRYGRELMRKSSLKTIRRFRVRLERFKLTRKKYIKFQLMKEKEVWEEMEKYAEEKKITHEEALERVESYIDEIVPFFNVLSYYKFGYGLAHFLLNLIFNVVINREGFGFFT